MSQHLSPYIDQLPGTYILEYTFTYYSIRYIFIKTIAVLLFSYVLSSW